jgi:small-conductance mechanosensitive channel
VTLDVGVDYGSDLTKVEQIATSVATEIIRDVAGAVPDVPPVVRFRAFSDLSVKFTVQVRAREVPDQGLIKHELLKCLHARLESEGIILRPPAAPISSRSE